MKYPNPEYINHTDNYHGTKIHDPYRYMEDPEDYRTLKFVEDNNKLVDDFVEPATVDYFKNEFSKYYEDDEYSVPIERNGRFFYWRKSGTQLQPVIYMREGLDGIETPIIDVNQLSKDGTTSAMVHSPSPNGNIYAMSLSVHGSDWQEIYIKNLDTGEVMERLHWMTFPQMAWNKDSSGFYYDKYPNQEGLSPEEQRRYHKLYFHKIGTPQDQDILIFDPQNKEEGVSSFLSSDKSYLFVYVSESTLPENKLFFRKESRGTSGPFEAIVAEYDNSSYEIIDTNGDTLYLKTSWNAPRNRVVAVDLNNPSKSNWKEVIPESNKLLQGALMANNTLIINYQVDVKNQLMAFNLEGQHIYEIELPAIGALSSYEPYGASIRGNKETHNLFFSFTSFVHPITVYHYNLNDKNLTKLFTSKNEVNPDEFEIKQVFYQSKDGSSIPMYIAHKKGLELNGDNPTFLYGYGGFNVSVLPVFLPRIIVWLNQGWVYAQANLRGGGEYGKQWHEQALLGNKQNVFDDFISAGEWLIENTYTNNAKLAINGRSNGGLLVGATMLQRPDLFGAAVPQVGVLDMLRFPFQPDAGRFWAKEYGNAKEHKDHFEFLIKFSPVHNVKSDVEYPPTLITAAEGDDRVAPMHSKKFAASLQTSQKGINPILMRIETKTGHGFGKSTEQKIEDFAIMFAFLQKVLLK